MTEGIERAAAALDKAIASDNKAKRKRLRVVKGGGETFNSSGRRVIRHDPGKIPEVLDQTGQALAEHCKNLFDYNGRLACIYPARESAGEGVHRARGALIVHQVDGPHLAELATRAAIHERYDARSESYKVWDCPRRVADAYISRGHWPELPPLSGFIEAPTITTDGRIFDQPGYDVETGLFRASSGIAGYDRPPAKPTRADAEASKQVLLDLVNEFAFVGNEDRCATLAGMITGLVRRILPAAPLVAITAPTPGTGKTLIAETFAIITTGRRASVLSLGHDDAEAEKRLGAALMAGDACINQDNVERALKGELQCQVTTQQFVRLRPLGGSVMLSIPTHALMIATGNNLAIVGDLKRRVMLIRMDAGMERPEQRTFKHDHLEGVLAQRGALIRAALTIPLAYLAAGAPAVDGLLPFGGFEQWDRLVRRPLVWLGLPDPLKASEGLREMDPDLEGMRLLLGAWFDEFGEHNTTAADVVAAGMKMIPFSSDYENPELRDALQLICAEKPNTRRLGYWLRQHRDRIVDGMQIKQSTRDEHTKIAKWQVIKCG